MCRRFKYILSYELESNNHFLDVPGMPVFWPPQTELYLPKSVYIDWRNEQTPGQSPEQGREDCSQRVGAKI